MTSPCSLLFYPSRPQEGSIPSPSWLEVQEVGDSTWIPLLGYLTTAVATDIHYPWTCQTSAALETETSLCPALRPPLVAIE
ncbi:hypothetical protein HBH56_017160 [Parastagonospora nodorum]|nr:hypothetical protein HBH56_017160 [Parastagonospora nodorum]KAH3937034.1 hypothetical protein HBH54_017310 [Parastagonospora nodorum]KAH3953773.1 hypothetical protein HBH53_029680 [Parastagonospora nodorum]KAH3962764.1 hypothetical protein HBH51_172300 [Parastagonospora nodorum]KAH3990632.1 hypothetical protein HBH52_006670 [Parastagonospora nodorum]